MATTTDHDGSVTTQWGEFDMGDPGRPIYCLCCNKHLTWAEQAETFEDPSGTDVCPDENGQHWAHEPWQD